MLDERTFSTRNTIGGIDPDPGPEPEIPILNIKWTEPATGATFNGQVTTGATVKAAGTIESSGYTIDDVRVKFGTGGFLSANYSATTKKWSRSLAVTTAGSMPITVRVTARKFDGETPTNAKAERTVTVALKDDAPPAITLTKPLAGQTFSEQAGSPNTYLVPVSMTASDPAGVLWAEYSQDSGANWVQLSQDANSPTVWKGTATLKYDRDPQSVKVRATDGHFNTSDDLSRDVVTLDQRAPIVKIKTPKDDNVNLPMLTASGGVLPLLKGTAGDSQSKVAKVEWRLNGGGWQLATKGANWSSWRVEHIAIPGPIGIKTIDVRATDNAGNTSDPVRLTIGLTEAYPPKDPTVTEYFGNLVDFVARRIVTPANQPVNLAVLTAALHQPFQQLLALDPAAAGDQVSQLRICLDVLRGHLNTVMAGNPDAEDAQLILAGAEKTYRQATYETVLRRLGTSLDELRSVVRSPLAVRQALAERLGFELLPLRTTGPKDPADTLALFLIPVGAVTDANLLRLFGVANPAGDPFAPATGDPLLLDLQLARLEESWLGQDGVAGTVLVDPDVIAEPDLRTGVNPATELLVARRNWLVSLIEALGAPTPTKTSPEQRFDEVAGRAALDMRDLLRMAAQYEAGEDIEPELAGRHLGLAAFNRILTLRGLATAEMISDTEWAEYYAILSQVLKLRAAPDWRLAEEAARITLGPTLFAVGPVERAGEPPSSWRTVPGARVRWRSTLTGRIEQERTLRQGLAAVVAAAEEDVLPPLRDGVVAAIGVVAPVPGDPVAALSDRLMIDVSTSGAQRISRTEHAIGTLQTLLLALRTGAPFDWKLKPGVETVEEFDEELRWIGSYSAWYAAMQAFLYPENLLNPTLRPANETTGRFKTLLAAVRADDRLTPERARQLAADYGAPNAIVLARTSVELAELRVAAANAVNTPANANKPAIEKLRDTSVNVKERYYSVPLLLAMQLHRSGQYLAALDWFRMVFAYDLDPGVQKTWYGLALERDGLPNRPLLFARVITWLSKTLNPHDVVDESYEIPAAARFDVHTRFTVMAIVRCLLDFADAEFTQDTNEALPRARALYARAARLLARSELNPAKVPGLSPNEAVANLKLRAEAGLTKLRTGRNFAGLSRQLATVPALSAGTGQPLVDGGGPFGSSSLRAFQPSPYRYSALIERARQLTTVAAQVEQSYLTALERRDSEAYSLLKANQDLSLAHANVKLQDLRVTEAIQGEVLARTQTQRSEYQVQAYQGLLDASTNQWENALLDDYRDVRDAKNMHAQLDAALTAAQAITSAASGGILGTGIGAGDVTALATAAAAFMKANQTVKLNRLDFAIQKHGIYASVENRRRDWALQQGVAQKDLAIAQQQTVVAGLHTGIVRAEGVVAQAEYAHARATVEFLTGKFTNVELYEWMIGVLRDVYAWFLRQATSVAQTAQNQLAFERQDVVPLFVRGDYWDSLSPEGALSGDVGPDRRGLTGSARLLRDIAQLDEFAAETNRRKLQLTKTLSLARLAPLEFQRFRETGVLTFATPMSLFDADFPGHYLRLIKRVRTSVVALVPPYEGIRATLSTAGVSRVTVGGDSFQTVPLRREPESVALTSPGNATGTFELEGQPELLAPFEYLGVDALWQLEMPKAANPIDYRTIADVLVTIEYTALASPDHRRTVIGTLDRTVLASRVFSLRDELPDQWYDLNNPEKVDRPFVIDFPTTARDFPPNIDQLAVSNLALYVVFADRSHGKRVRASLEFAPDGRNTPPVGGGAESTSDGIISTRLGNAPGWLPIVGSAPVGNWRLALADTPELRRLFEEELVADVVFAVGYTARTPEWPL